MAKKKTGRPISPPLKVKSRYLQVRVNQAEKAGFDLAAETAGLPLSTWVRERLRSTAYQELKEMNMKIPFLTKDS
jgi:predicted HicB family RNase H-like nuclease